MTRRDPSTTPARTILDLGAALDPPALEQVVAEAHRRGMASADNLHALMGCHPRGAGHAGPARAAQRRPLFRVPTLQG